MTGEVSCAGGSHATDIFNWNSTKCVLDCFALVVQVLADTIDKHFNIRWKILVSCHSWLMLHARRWIKPTVLVLIARLRVSRIRINSLYRSLLSKCGLLS